MTQETLFKSNQTQAVRLPKAVAFPDGVKPNAKVFNHVTLYVRHQYLHLHD